MEKYGSGNGKSGHYITHRGMRGGEWRQGQIFFFRIWEGVPIVTRRTKELLEAGKMKNVQYTPLEEVVLPTPF